MSSSSPAATPPSNADPQATIPDDLTPENADLPLPLSASIVLTSLPHDASTALEKASREDNDGVPAKGMSPTFSNFVKWLLLLSVHLSFWILSLLSVHLSFWVLSFEFMM